MFKNKILEYFKSSYFFYYYNLIGTKLFYYIFLCLLVGLLDGIGLILFIPLLEKSKSSKTDIISNSEVDLIDVLFNRLEDFGFILNFNNILILIAFIFLVKGLVKFYQLNYHVKIRTDFIKLIRTRIVAGLNNLNFNYFHNLNVGRAQNVVTLEVNKLYQSFQFYFLTIQNIIIIFIYSFLAFISNYRFSLFVVVGAIIINSIFKLFYKKSKIISIRISDNNNKFNLYFIEFLNYYKYLKSTAVDRFYIKRLDESIHEEKTLQSKIGKYSAFITGFKEPLVISVVLGLIYIEITFFETVLASILVSVILFYRALTALSVVQNYWQSFIANSGAFSNLNHFLIDVENNPNNDFGRNNKKLSSRILFKDVSLILTNKEILKSLNLEFVRNKIYLLYGPSGSGKTTFTNLLTGLVKYTDGEILIDDVPLYNINQKLWRSRIGLVSQENVIFNDSIFNNITLWSEMNDLNYDKFLNVIKIASLDDFYNQISDPNYILGVNGSNISGGQRQRIAIARELYKDIDIIIFDEATSALDNKNANVIWDTINKIKNDYFIFVISHKKNDLQYADKIINF